MTEDGQRNGCDAVRHTWRRLSISPGLAAFSWRVAKNQITGSRQLYRIFEFTPGKPVTFDMICRRIHPDDFAVMNDLIEKAQRSVTDLEYEYRLLMPDSSVKYLHTVAHAARDHEGGLEYIGSIQDVTQRRLSEEALDKARSEARARGQSHEPGSIDSIDRARGQPATGGHHHQRQYLHADACRRAAER